MSQASHYMMIPYGHRQVPFPSQLCEFYLHLAGPSHGTESFPGIPNLPISDPAIVEPGGPYIIQPGLQEGNELHQEILISKSPFNLTPALTAPEIGSRGSEEQRAQWLVPTTETAMDAEVPLVKTRRGRLAAERDANGKIPCPTCHRTYLRLHHLRRHMRKRRTKYPDLDETRHSLNDYRFGNQTIFLCSLSPEFHEKRFAQSSF